MKIKDVTNKVNEALDGVAAKAERTRLTKWIIVALVALLLVYVYAFWPSKARATGFEHAVVKPLVVAPVAAPPVVAPPAASAAVPPSAAAPASPSTQPSGGGGGGSSWLAKGGWAMIGVTVFFYAVICTAERWKNPQGWFARRCRPQDWVKPEA